MKKIFKFLIAKPFAKFQKKVIGYKFLAAFGFVVLLIYELFFNKAQRDLNYFWVLFVWFVIIVIFKLKSRFTLLICLILLSLLFSFYITGAQSILDSISNYLYLFLIVVFVQEMIEILV
jgi:hypothetical protein